MANRFNNPAPQFFDASGEMLAGGLLYFYTTGTSTPADTYSDEDLGTENANPVVLDSAGRAGPIFLDPSVTYKCVLKDADGSEIWSRDPVVDPAANVTASFQVYAGDPNTNVAGSAGSVGGSGASVVYDITNDLLYVCTTTGDAANAVWTQIAADFSGSLVFSGVLSPAALSSDQNNYNPSGLGSASMVRLTSSVAVSLTGLAGGSDGRFLTIYNIGSNTITLADESTSSTAANRFSLGRDVAIVGGSGLVMQYDGTSSRWRIAATGPAEPLGRLAGINTQTGDYTLAITDAGKTVEINSASSEVVTIPTNASVAFPIGTYINIVRYGAGAVTITADTGVTLNGVSAGSGSILDQYGGVTLYKRDTNTWVVPNVGVS